MPYAAAQITPRQPSRSGRQDKVTRAKERVVKRSNDKTHSTKGTLSGPPAGSSTSKPSKTSAKAPSTTARKAAIVSEGYNPIAPARVNDILKRLDERYPNVTCALNHAARGNCSSQRSFLHSAPTYASISHPALFEQYPTPEAFAALKPEDIEDDIRSTGFFRNKSKSLVGAARKVIGDFGGEVPRTMDELLTIPGVARKTANVVLGSWYKSPTASWSTRTCSASRGGWS